MVRTAQTAVTVLMSPRVPVAAEIQTTFYMIKLFIHHWKVNKLTFNLTVVFNGNSNDRYAISIIFIHDLNQLKLPTVNFD